MIGYEHTFINALADFLAGLKPESLPSPTWLRHKSPSKSVTPSLNRPNRCLEKV